MTEKDGPPRAAFETMCSGYLPERLEHELQRIYDNIADENTDPEAKRKLVVEFTWKPNRERDASDVAVEFKPKLAPMMAAHGRVFLRIAPDGSQCALVDSPPEQGTLFPTTPQVTALPRKEAANG